MVTVVDELTTSVVMTNAALVDPAGTVTLAGTIATDVLLLDRVTRAPPLGAGALRATLPVEGDPPLTLVGFNRSDTRVAVADCGMTVREPVCVTPA
jgi:hypothetical protein